MGNQQRPPMQACLPKTSATWVLWLKSTRRRGVTIASRLSTPSKSPLATYSPVSLNAAGTDKNALQALRKDIALVRGSQEELLRAARCGLPRVRPRVGGRDVCWLVGAGRAGEHTHTRAHTCTHRATVRACTVPACCTAPRSRAGRRSGSRGARPAARGRGAARRAACACATCAPA